MIAFILICAMELSSCDVGNAIDVLVVPNKYDNAATCFMHAQAYLAQTELTRENTDHIKIICKQLPNYDHA